MSDWSDLKDGHIHWLVTLMSNMKCVHVCYLTSAVIMKSFVKVVKLQPKCTVTDARQYLNLTHFFNFYFVGKRMKCFWRTECVFFRHKAKLINSVCWLTWQIFFYMRKIIVKTTFLWVRSFQLTCQNRCWQRHIKHVRNWVNILRHDGSKRCLLNGLCAWGSWGSQL